MWDAIQTLLLSQELWSAIAYLIIGAIVGAIVSVRYSISARRPRLIIFGGGGGGNQQNHRWQISISNRPSFFGKALDGESARDVHAHIRLHAKRSQSYLVFWGHQAEHRATIEPGQQHSLDLFHWQRGTEGYFIADDGGEPVARFQDRELKFVLTLRDRLERKTQFRFLVEFDDTHLQHTPRLQIVHPITLGDRINRAKRGIRQFLSAFRPR